MSLSRTKQFYNVIAMGLIVAILQGCQTNNQHHEQLNVLPQYKYIASKKPMGEVDSALIKAKESGKKLVVVLGAQWCHDSRGLSAKFSTDAMQAVLQEHYETVFVDVGFLEDRQEITQRFSQPMYFGTPTVLIVEPHSEKLLNRNNILKWLSADSVELNDYVEDFSKFATIQSDEISNDLPADSVHAKQLEDFSRLQAQRLIKANELLGPLLRDYKQDQDNGQFNDMWSAVRNFRITLLKDLIRLHDEAQMKLATNDQSSLVMPSYPAFDWETQ